MNFPDDIVAYDLSPDGEQLALTRYAASDDVVPSATSTEPMDIMPSELLLRLRDAP